MDLLQATHIVSLILLDDNLENRKAADALELSTEEIDQLGEKAAKNGERAMPLFKNDISALLEGRSPSTNGMVFVIELQKMHRNTCDLITIFFNCENNNLQAVSTKTAQIPDRFKSLPQVNCKTIVEGEHNNMFKVCIRYPPHDFEVVELVLDDLFLHDDVAKSIRDIFVITSEVKDTGQVLFSCKGSDVDESLIFRIEELPSVRNVREFPDITT